MCYFCYYIHVAPDDVAELTTSAAAARPCGCVEGAVGGFASLGAYLIAWIALAVAGLGTLTPWIAVALAFVVFTSGVAAGKVIGIRRGERRFADATSSSITGVEPQAWSREIGEAQRG